MEVIAIVLLLIIVGLMLGSGSGPRAPR